MKLNRFKQLLESKMGDAKPLIIEQTTATYTTQKFNQFYYRNSSGHQVIGFNPGVKFEATKNSKIVTAKNVDVLKFWNNKWESKGKKRVSFYCEQGKFFVEGENLPYVDESKKLDPNLVKNVCGKTAVVTPLAVTPPSDHVCDDKIKSKLHQGKSYKYCKNGEKYYFIGTTGEFKTKNPNWTEATGKGLESIKTMIGPVFDKML